jgi:hypothetical protein
MWFFMYRYDTCAVTGSHVLRIKGLEDSGPRTYSRATAEYATHKNALTSCRFDPDKNVVHKTDRQASIRD